MGLFFLDSRVKNPEPREDHKIGDSSKKRRVVLRSLASLREKKANQQSVGESYFDVRRPMLGVRCSDAVIDQRGR